MPKYVLHYFDFAGSAEPTRVLFHQAGVEFEDRRIKSEDWPALKPNGKLYPFGHIPVLEVDGVAIAESQTISRYVAAEFGLYGKTNLDRAKGDMLVDGINEMIDHMRRFFPEKDEAVKAALMKAFFEEHLPKWLKMYEERHVPKDGFFLGNEVSRADIHFMTFLDMVIYGHQKEHMLDSLPLCKALFERTKACPNIKKYYDSKKK